MMRWILSVLIFATTWLKAADVLVVTIDQAITVASSQIVSAAISQARADNAKLVVIELDTPGGFPNSTREIVAAMQSAPMPVAVYVTPAGARAASAGTFIVYGADIAAMTPTTTIGAATPINLFAGKGADEKESDENARPVQDAAMAKVTNDILAYSRALAQQSGRSESFITKAVTEAKSIGAKEALAEGVIEIVAQDRQDLFAQLQGWVLKNGAKDGVLSFSAESVKQFEPTWRMQILSIICDPTVAYVLLLGGLYGILFELYSPGALFPGVFGALCLILAGYALQLLPFNFAGILLILLGAALMVAELMMPSFGILGFGAVIAFVLGGIFLFDTGGWFVGISMGVLSLVSVVLVAIFVLIGRMAVQAHRRTPYAGNEELIGARGTCTVRIWGEGEVRVNGERWRAKSDQQIAKGQPVVIERVDKLTLHVRLTDNRE